jgi:hypothetical protein
MEYKKYNYKWNLKDTKFTNSEPEIKKVKDKKTTKKIKLEELVVNEKI